MKYEKLGNIAEIIAGQSPPSNEYNKNGIGVPFFQGKADFGAISPVVRSWTTKTTKLAVPNDILMSVRAPVGPVNLNNINACIGRGLSAIRVHKNISNEYLLHYLKVNEKVISKMGVGSTFAAITQKDLASINIPLPEKLEEQICIASILTQSETLIQERKESINLLDEFVKSTFLKMFIYNYDTKKWKFTEVKNTVEKHKNAIKAGPFGSSLKKEFYVESGYKIYGQEQVIKDDLTFGNYYIDYNLYKKLESCKIKEGDILISLVGTYGKISLVPKEFEEGIINPRLMKISFDKEIINPVFFKQLFQSEYLLQQLPKLSRGGTMDIINVGIVKDIKIPVPPLDLQNHFATIVEKAEVLKSQFKDSLNGLENLFGALSQKAFKGELLTPNYLTTSKTIKVEKLIKKDKDNPETIDIDKIITPQMQEFIDSTNALTKMIPKTSATIKLPVGIEKMAQQVEFVNKMMAPFEKIPKLPDAVVESMKSFANMRSISDLLSKNLNYTNIGKTNWTDLPDKTKSSWLILKDIGSTSNIEFNEVEGMAVFEKEFDRENNYFTFQNFEEFVKNEKFIYTYKDLKKLFFKLLDDKKIEQIFLTNSDKNELGNSYSDQYNLDFNKVYFLPNKGVAK